MSNIRVKHYLYIMEYVCTFYTFPFCRFEPKQFVLPRALQCPCPGPDFITIYINDRSLVGVRECFKFEVLELFRDILFTVVA